MAALSSGQRQRKPDFFIVGAPKSGTTALKTYLSKHPRVFIPRAKELHYFGSDMSYQGGTELSEEDYCSYFRGANPNQLAGEKSVFYLYSREAAGEIYDFRPDAKMIIMLRDPVEMMYSLHRQFLFVGWEEISSFREALAAEPERKKGRRVPTGLQQRELLYYRDIARYAQQVERFLKVFDRQQVHIILFDDFVEDPRASFERVLAFLGLETDFQVDLSPVNVNTEPRFQFLPRLLRTTGLLDFVKSVIPSRLWGYMKPYLFALYRMNTKESTRPALDPELERSLREELAPDIRKLADLIDRDLSCWENGQTGKGS